LRNGLQLILNIVPRSFIRVAAAMTVAALAGCAGVPQAPPSPASTADSNTVAVASLMENARSDASAGRLANAAASMERAIRLARGDAKGARAARELAKRIDY
jgi:hypothetical protein